MAQQSACETDMIVIWIALQILFLKRDFCSHLDPKFNSCI